MLNIIINYIIVILNINKKKNLFNYYIKKLKINNLIYEIFI